MRQTRERNWKIFFAALFPCNQYTSDRMLKSVALFDFTFWKPPYLSECNPSRQSSGHWANNLNNFQLRQEIKRESCGGNERSKKKKGKDRNRERERVVHTTFSLNSPRPTTKQTLVPTHSDQSSSRIGTLSLIQRSNPFTQANVPSSPKYPSRPSFDLPNDDAERWRIDKLQTPKAPWVLNILYESRDSPEESERGSETDTNWTRGGWAHN